MNINFKKVSAIAASALMVGLTMGTAVAANYPAPFVSSGSANVAVVYGTGAGVSQFDQVQAGNIETYLNSKVTSTGSASVLAGDVKLTDDEVALRGSIYGDKITDPITDNKLSGLKDERFSWDDGDGSDEYDYHEEIDFVGNSKVLIPTVDDEKLEGVALSNEKALEYKLVFEDTLNTTKVGTDDADTLYLNIMGEEYEIESMSAASDSITVSTSKQMSMSKGSTYSIEGKTVTVEGVYEQSVAVNVGGQTEVVTTSKKINGIKIEVEDIGYHSNSPDTSVAVLKIGKDITKTYSNGDEFIGEDEDEPLWVWDISFTNSAGVTSVNDYIGVRYNADIDSSNDNIAGDSIKYVGDGYVFPNNYAAVTLDSLTDAKYQDVKIRFEESVDLFNAADNSTARHESKPVLVIEAEEESAISVGSEETNMVYVWFNTATEKFETYYKDVGQEFSPANYFRFAENATVAIGTDTNLTAEEIATIEVGDTNLNVTMSVLNGVGTLIVKNNDYTAGDNLLRLTLGGTAITNTTGTLERFGSTADEAQAGDVYFNNSDVSLKDYDFMDGYGVFLSKGTTVNDQADDDMVILSIPEEQVYAQVTVSMGATVEDSTTDVVVVKDTEVESVKTKNLIIVGGSCINSVAANLLGATCGADFTAKTNVGTGQFLIQSIASPYASGKVALVVAGYETDDTVNAATYLDTKTVETTAGKKYIGTTAIAAALDVSSN